MVSQCCSESCSLERWTANRIIDVKISLSCWYALTCLWMKFRPLRRFCTWYVILVRGSPPLMKYECSEVGKKFSGTVYSDASSDCDTSVPPNVPLDPTGAPGRYRVTKLVGDSGTSSSIFSRLDMAILEALIVGLCPALCVCVLSCSAVVSPPTHSVPEWQQLYIQLERFSLC